MHGLHHVAQKLTTMGLPSFVTEAASMVLYSKVWICAWGNPCAKAEVARPRANAVTKMRMVSE
jgi:hypothetical protein